MKTFQLDRMITLGLTSPALKAVRSVGLLRSSTRTIPILMYHSVSDDTESGKSGYYKVCTAPRIFRQHLQILAEEEFSVIDLPTAVKVLSQPEVKTASRMAVITFDDGFQDFHSAAWPLLEEFGFTATVFLPTQYIGEQRQEFQGKPCLVWSEVRELRRRGIQFGSHTVSHPKLVKLKSAEFSAELRDSKRTMEEQMGEVINVFCHPYAFPSADRQYVQRYLDTLQACGYEIAATTTIGRARAGHNPLILKRLPINSSDDPQLFRAKLHGAYDWMEAPQRIIKRLKHMLNKDAKVEAQENSGSR